MRDLIHHLFSDLVAGTAPADGPMAALNQQLKKLRSGQKLEWLHGELRWSPIASRGTTTIMDRIAVQAAELLTSEDLQRLRTCANPQCGWLFLDTTKKWPAQMVQHGGMRRPREVEALLRLAKEAIETSDARVGLEHVGVSTAYYDNGHGRRP
jgi:hypothetical protein